MINLNLVRVKRYSVHGKLGGNWDNAAKCGSRSSNWNNSPLNLNSNNSARGVTDTDRPIFYRVAGLHGLLADCLTLMRYFNKLTSKYTATAPLGLVISMNVREGVLL